MYLCVWGLCVEWVIMLILYKLSFELLIASGGVIRSCSSCWGWCIQEMGRGWGVRWVGQVLLGMWVSLQFTYPLVIALLHFLCAEQLVTIILEQAEKVYYKNQLQYILHWYFVLFVSILCLLMPQFIEAFVIAIVMQLHSLLLIFPSYCLWSEVVVSLF